MPANRALQALSQAQSLIQDQGQVEDAATALARVEDMRPQFDGDDAGFALPESVATAVAAGFILGPVGGLLMGAAQGFLMQRERQGILDAVAEEQGALSSAADVVQERINDAYAQPGNSPQDIEYLDNVQARLDMAGRMYRSGNLQLMRDAQPLLEGALTELQTFTTQQEQQAIEASVRENTERLALGEQQYNRHTALLASFDAETQPFRDTYQRAQQARELLARGSSADVLGVLASMPLIINPQAGATSEGEVAIWSGVGNLFDRLENKIEKELGEGGLTRATRQELADVVDTVSNQSANGLRIRQSQYQKRARIDAGLPDYMVERYDVLSDYPELQRLDIAESVAAGTPSEEQQLRNAIGEGASQLVDAIDPQGVARDTVSDFIEEVGNVREETMQGRRERALRRLRRPTN